VGCLQCQDSMTIIEVKLEWYLEVITRSVAMQVSMKTITYFKGTTRQYFRIPTVLPSAIKFALAFLFADNTKCYMRIKATEDILRLQEDIDSIFSWRIKNNLLLNLTKCVFMQFKLSRHTSYHINNSTLPPATSHKDPVVIFSHDLKWSLHYQYIITKL